LMAGAGNGERIVLAPEAFGETEEQWTILAIPHNPAKGEEF
jgi:hypothetical protein